LFSSSSSFVTHLSLPHILVSSASFICLFMYSSYTCREIEFQSEAHESRIQANL
jgi:hypothetical protein